MSFPKPRHLAQAAFGSQLQMSEVQRMYALESIEGAIKDNGSALVVRAHTTRTAINAWLEKLADQSPQDFILMQWQDLLGDQFNTTVKYQSDDPYKNAALEAQDDLHSHMYGRKPTVDVLPEALDSTIKTAEEFLLKQGLLEEWHVTLRSGFKERVLSTALISQLPYDDGYAARDQLAFEHKPQMERAKELLHQKLWPHKPYGRSLGVRITEGLLDRFKKWVS